MGQRAPKTRHSACGVRDAAVGLLMKEQFLSHIPTASSQTESCLGYQTLSLPLSCAPFAHPGAALAGSTNLARITATTQDEIDQPRLFPRWDYFQKEEILPKDKKLLHGEGDGILGPGGESWVLVLPTHKDSREIKYKRQGHLPHSPFSRAFIWRERVCVLCKGARLADGEDPHRDKALPALLSLLWAPLAQNTKLAWASNPNSRKGKHKRRFSVLLQAESIPHRPSPHLRLALSLAELKADLFPPRFSQTNFLNCMKTENKQKTKSTKAWVSRTAWQAGATC